MPPRFSMRVAGVSAHSDTAILLALAHTLVARGIARQRLLGSVLRGFERFRDYLFGATDGVVKNADWAAHLSEIPLTLFAVWRGDGRARRTMITANLSLQRGDHGEQPFWRGSRLRPYSDRSGSRRRVWLRLGSMEGLADVRPRPDSCLSIGSNPVKSFIPVARSPICCSNPVSLSI